MSSVPVSEAALANDAQAAPENPTLIDELIDAVGTGDVKRRLRILLRITDLFAAGSRSYSGQQIALFDDVMRELAADIEVKARIKLAQKLAAMDNAPPKLVRALAFDDAIVVAGPVLSHSPQLSDDDLVENAASKSQEHLLAIAERLSVSEAVTDVLVERGDRRVVHKIVSNKGAHFSLAGYGKLTIRARNDRKLTLALGRRSDIPRQYFLKLLETASASVRTKLEADNPQAAEAIRETIDGLATTIQREVRDASQEHAMAVRETNRRLRVSPISEASVHAPARSQEFEKTAVALARLGRFPLDLVERALLDEGEDMVLLLAKAAGCSWTTARELLLMYAANRALSAEDLTRSFERYKKLSQKTALSIVRFQERSSSKKAPANGESAVVATADRPALADAAV
jgi:uncharacterized protein (DUF2336 family)